MLTQHVKAHDVGVVREPHDQPDREERDLVEVSGERRHNAGHEKYRIGDEKRLKHK